MGEASWCVSCDHELTILLIKSFSFITRQAPQERLKKTRKILSADRIKHKVIQ